MNRSTISAEELETLSPEVRALYAEQQADDTSSQNPQKYDGERFVSLDAVAQSSYAVSPDHADEVCDRLSGEAPADDLESAEHVGLAAVLSELPADLAETYALIYVERLSQSEAAARLTISQQAVSKRVARLHAVVTGAL